MEEPRPQFAFSFALAFAVVREDPDLEAQLVADATQRGGRGARVLCVASGGCTALTLAARPSAGLQGAVERVVAFDRSPIQIAHARAKQAAVLRGDVASLGVDVDDPTTLTQRGRFEGLFRTLRRFLEEFGAPRAEIERFFLELRGDAAGRRALARSWRANPYFSVAFELALHPSLLDVMFGPDATRHAPPRSYAPYFERAFARALDAPEAAANPFLQHVLLGRYLGADAPAYVRAESFGPIDWVTGSLADALALGPFDVVSLSNIFDWSDDGLVGDWAARLGDALDEGASVLVRFLNNARRIDAAFDRWFVLDEARSRALLERDRSFFYERIEVFVRRAR